MKKHLNQFLIRVAGGSTRHDGRQFSSIPQRPHHTMPSALQFCDAYPILVLQLRRVDLVKFMVFGNVE